MDKSKETEHPNDVIKKIKSEIADDNIKAEIYDMYSKSNDEHAEELQEFAHEILKIADPKLKFQISKIKRSQEIIEKILSFDFHFLKKEQNYLMNIIYGIDLLYKNLGRQMIKELSEEMKNLDLSNEQKQKLEKRLKKFEPKSKSNEDLVKTFLKIAITINDIPTLDQLESKIYSKTSWHRKLRNIFFLTKLNEECEKRLNKKLSEKNKELIIKVKNYVLKNSKNCQITEKGKTGITKKSKPDYDDTYSDNEYNDEY